MALFLHTILPSPPSCLALRGFCPPPSVALSHSKLRHPVLSSKALSHICCQPRACLSGRDPQPSDGEDPFSKRQEIPASSRHDPKVHDDENVNSSVVSSGPSSTSEALDSPISSSSTPVNNVVALQVERDRQQDDLRETLNTLSRSMELLSATLSEISSAVRLLSATLDNKRQVQAASSTAGSGSHHSPTELRAARESQALQGILPVDPPEPWDNAATVGGSGGPVDEDRRRSEEDKVPLYLVEQNERAHKVAYMLQQAFIQARIKGLGKPFQLKLSDASTLQSIQSHLPATRLLVAAEDFVQGCMGAHRLGIGVKELQLQLVLQDGSLTGAFAIRNQRWSDDPILSEESRVRSLWVRLVYSTLAQVGPNYTDDQEMDPIDAFVKQVLQLAVEQGYDLERLKVEQAFAGPDIASGAVKAMRENQYLILLTLEKTKAQTK